MKVLVDSCIWSLSIRRRNGFASLNKDEQHLVSRLVEGIKDGRVVIVGPVRQEVLSGIKHDEQFEKVRLHLVAFPDEPIHSHDYVRAAQLDNFCRKAGVQCGEVDMLLCALAERNGWTILTNDGGLMDCIDVIERVVFGADETMSGRKLHE